MTLGRNIDMWQYLATCHTKDLTHGKKNWK